MDLDPIPQATSDDPHAVYRALREEHPVHYVEDRNLWILSRHEDVLAAIKAAGAFRRDTEGGRTIQEIVDFDDRIQHLSGKTSFNAFMGTDLAEVLRKEGVDHVIVAGVITSLCIDSSARAAVENGFAVTILSDASAGRDQTEHSLYCESIFPLYAEVKSTEELLAHGLDPEHAS